MPLTGVFLRRQLSAIAVASWVPCQSCFHWDGTLIRATSPRFKGGSSSLFLFFYFISLGCLKRRKSISMSPEHHLSYGLLMLVWYHQLTWTDDLESTMVTTGGEGGRLVGMISAVPTLVSNMNGFMRIWMSIYTVVFTVYDLWPFIMTHGMQGMIESFLEMSSSHTHE